MGKVLRDMRTAITETNQVNKLIRDYMMMASDRVLSSNCPHPVGTGKGQKKKTIFIIKDHNSSELSGSSLSIRKYSR